MLSFISFVYLFYVKTFELHLSEIRLTLLEEFSKKNIFRAIIILKKAKNVYHAIETAVSFSAFLAYVLTFTNILYLVCGFISDYLAEDKNTQNGYSLIIFLWTVSWFILLTVCGSQATGIECFIKNMIQEVISSNFDKNPEKYKEFEYLNLMNSCSKFKLQFTGWGMFVVDKRLFLTITGIVVTYGALLASTLS
ncbi:uncharacterized protein NPIL_25171 [Nephila pilipes]|uniref:Uncharacterized protein n=1 Tax=Nephila pilipes TaxID=299642 RepID=A0A8X6PFC7_NEPPI|nr:uncharacterized protein NPIL_25171 [Nephila pilipes]